MIAEQNVSLPSRERGLKCGGDPAAAAGGASLPSRERGLKSATCPGSRSSIRVAPLAGAWIEIVFILLLQGYGTTSLPSQERGLKYRQNIKTYNLSVVAPLAGAWIEIAPDSTCFCSPMVAPLAGAWIEMGIATYVYNRFASLPSRERGLKFGWMDNRWRTRAVAPLAGAWIEIARMKGSCGIQNSRSPREGVD